ncbi:hypothetical protein GEMRC1_009332 [Eukaryota sp. GEM-RC1]
MLSIVTKPTTSFSDQKPGTSGLRKKVSIFKQPNYCENFIQAIFSCSALQARTTGSSIVIGGDGRYYADHVLQLAVKIAAANLTASDQISTPTIYVAKNGYLSTPACSAFIRTHKLFGGLLLTASHNPGGPTEDLGIKWNTENGGPAPLSVTESISNYSKQVEEYRIVEDLIIDPSTLSSQDYSIDGAPLRVTVFDGVDDYVELMRELYDFDFLKTVIADYNISICFDAMYGIAGPYADRIFSELGISKESLLNTTPLPDFGGGHPDPNLVWAKDLVKRVLVDESYDIGAAADGDADRNMILSKGKFISPCDSVALIALFHDCLPQFSKHKLTGVARSMPTSAALDDVAEYLGIRVLLYSHWVEVLWFPY